MDRIERIGIRGPGWLRPELDPDGEGIAERRRRRPPEPTPPREREEDDDPPHHIDVIA